MPEHTNHHSTEELRVSITRLVAALASSGDNFRVAGETEPVSEEVKNDYVESFLGLFDQQLVATDTEAREQEAKLWLSKIEQHNDVNLLNWADERIAALQTKQDGGKG